MWHAYSTDEVGLTGPGNCCREKAGGLPPSGAGLHSTKPDTGLCSLPTLPGVRLDVNAKVLFHLVRVKANPFPHHQKANLAAPHAD